MLRSLLSLLAVLPTLLPAGRCICDLWTPACAAAACEDGSDTPATTRCSKCRCCHGRGGALAHFCSPTDGSHHVPRHTPACPVKERGYWLVRPGNSVLPAPALVGLAVAPAPAALPAAPVELIGRLGAAETPLFLTLRTLLI